MMEMPICDRNEWNHNFVKIEEHVFECDICKQVMVVSEYHINDPITMHIIGRRKPETYPNTRVETDVNYYKDLDQYIMENL